MTSAADIIDRSLKAIGATSILNPAAPELINDAFEYLVELLARWSAQNTNFGVTIPDVLGDDLEEPSFVTQAIIFTLGSEISPMARKDPSKHFLRMVSKTYKSMLVRINPRPKPCYPNTLPIGAGNKTGPKSRTFYPEPETVDNETGLPITTE